MLKRIIASQLAYTDAFVHLCTGELQSTIKGMGKHGQKTL
jgi:hypothetical protein